MPGGDQQPGQGAADGAGSPGQKDAMAHDVLLSESRTAACPRKGPGESTKIDRKGCTKPGEAFSEGVAVFSIRRMHGDEKPESSDPMKSPLAPAEEAPAQKNAPDGGGSIRRVSDQYSSLAGG
jgi:hypothetical protein